MKEKVGLGDAGGVSAQEGAAIKTNSGGGGAFQDGLETFIRLRSCLDRLHNDPFPAQA